MHELGVFARYWSPGKVKTRLARTIGDEAAAEIYRASLAVTLDRFSAAGDVRTVAFTPLERQAEMQAFAGTCWIARPQASGDLGQRIEHYFSEAFARGATRIVLIGSDSPTLPIAFVYDAWRQLADAPVVLGPAQDGGYYLVGLSQPLPALFADIAWSTPLVWSQTVARLQQLSVSWTKLPPWHDFDDQSDLRRLRTELADLLRESPEYQPLVDAIDRTTALP